MLSATPSYSLLLKFWPLPTAATSPTADRGLFETPASEKRDDNHADVKGDIRIGQISQLSLTYSRGRPSDLIPLFYVNHSNDRLFEVIDERGTAAYTTGGPQ